MSEKPDFYEAPERQIDSKTEKELRQEELEKENLKQLDGKLALIKKQKMRARAAFTFKYLGIWIIILGILKGVFFTFTPSFVIGGLGALFVGIVLQARHKKMLILEEGN